MTRKIPMTRATTMIVRSGHASRTIPAPTAITPATRAMARLPRRTAIWSAFTPGIPDVIGSTSQRPDRIAGTRPA